MSYQTLIDERIVVWAFFGFSTSNPILPIAINWRNRLIKFQKVIFMTTRKVGELKLVSLVCQSKGTNFELEYNTSTFFWKLKKVMPKD